MKIINLTPHAITIKNSDVNITVQPSGILARVNTSTESRPSIAGIPVTARVLGTVDFGGIAIEDDQIFLVSSMVLDAIPDDHGMAKLCFAPDTGNSAERNDKGHIVSVCQLVGK